MAKILFLYGLPSADKTTIYYKYIEDFKRGKCYPKKFNNYKVI